MHSLCFTERENIVLLNDKNDEGTYKESMQKITFPDQINMKQI